MKRKTKKCDLCHAVRYSVGSEQIFGIDGSYFRSECLDSPSPHGTSNNDTVQNAEGNSSQIGSTVVLKYHDQNKLKQLEGLRSVVLENMERVNKLKIDVLSKENGSYTSNDGKGRVKSLIMNSSILKDLEANIDLLQSNVNRSQDLFVQDGKRPGFELAIPYACICRGPGSIYVRDLCEKSGDIKIERNFYSSSIHIEQCADKGKHLGWLRSNNLVTISGCFSSPKIYISGLFVNTTVSIKGVGGSPEIHLEGVCIKPRILVHGTKLKPTVFIDGIVNDPYLQVNGLGSRLKLVVRGICFRQNVEIGGKKCHTKLRVFGMCDI